MYDIPSDVTLIGPDDEQAAAVWFGREAPNGRHALVIGDVQDGGVAYGGTLDELEAFTAGQLAQVQTARTGKLAPIDTPTTYGMVDGFDYDNFEFSDAFPIPYQHIVVEGHAYFRGPDGRLWIAPDAGRRGDYEWGCPQNVAEFDERVGPGPITREKPAYQAAQQALCALVDMARTARVQVAAAMLVADTIETEDPELGDKRATAEGPAVEMAVAPRTVERYAVDSLRQHINEVANYLHDLADSARSNAQDGIDRIGQPGCQTYASVAASMQHAVVTTLAHLQLNWLTKHAAEADVARAMGK